MTIFFESASGCEGSTETTRRIKSAISLFVSDRQGGVKLRVLEKLPRRPGHDKTMMRVIGWRFVTLMNPFAVGIEVIIPNQIIAVGKRVRLKIKRPRADKLLVARAATESNQKCAAES